MSRPDPIRFTVAGSEAGERLDQLVARHAGCSRAEARRLIERGAVRVGGRRAHKGRLVDAGVQVTLDEPPHAGEARRPLPQPELALEVLLSDEALVVMVKPFGIATHPLRAGERGTLANALVARFPECADASDDPREGGVAHRLDRDTSGVLVAARTRADWQALRRAFAGGRVEKEYWALVDGEPPDAGEVVAPLVHAGARRVRAIGEYEDAPTTARDARTRYEVISRGGGFALLRALTSTGRMHQVRAHLAHAGWPLYGDELYEGPPDPSGGGHFLHAARIAFPHPRSGARVELSAPLPAARVALLRELGIGLTNP